MANDYDLWCFVEGSETLFMVTISGSKLVTQLKDEIYKLWFGGGLANDFGAQQLLLLKVHIKIPPSGVIDPSLRAPDNTPILCPHLRIDHFWPSAAPKTHLQVCVRLPIRPTRKTRALSESEEDIHGRFKRSKAVTQAPSSFATSQNYKKLQKDFSERLLDDRPEPDIHLPPIPLLYSGFGHFLDIMDGRDDTPGLRDINVAELQKEVDGLAVTMNILHDKEHQRRDKGLGQLQKIFMARRGTTIPQLFSGSVGTVVPGVYNLSTSGITSIIVEFKNGPAGITSIPQVEIAGYMAHLAARLPKDFYFRWRVPCLGVTIIGSDIDFYALLALSHQIRLVRLTPTFSCIQSASDGRDRLMLYRAFTAASVLQAQILEDAMKIQDAGSDPTGTKIPIISIPARRFPAVSKLCKYGARGSYITFEIVEEFDLGANRQLYFATTGVNNKDIILVKFTKRYAIDLHALCATAGHAPSILGYERLPGGWFAVAMEYVESADSITNSPRLVQHKVRWAAELKKLVNDFHAQDFVHGDLRDVNIICKDKTVMLVDFDWGGKVGEAVYPSLDLHSELLEGRRVTAGSVFEISKDDDVRVLTKTLSKFTK